MKKRLLGWAKELLILLIMALVIATAVDLWRSKDFPKQALPSLQATTLTGELVDLALLSKEQPVLVYFWATWCSVCTVTSPAVDTLAQYYPVVTVALNSGDDKRVGTYLRQHDYNFPVVNDADYQLGNDWQIQVTPTILIIRDGEAKWLTTGFTSLPGLWLRLLLS